MMISNIPVITVDGPSGSGKGTLSRLLAQKLGWHFLDSGALYRVLALAAIEHGIDLNDPEDLDSLVDLASNLKIAFKEHSTQQSTKIMLEDEEVTQAIRTESCGAGASKVAAIPRVREALLARQRAFLEAPGLVADGRDMGTVVFPEANVKIFLEASAKERAKRRYKELHDKGLDVNLEAIFADIDRRDKRDRERIVAPLVPAADAFIVDTTIMDIQQVFEVVMAKIKKAGFVQ